MNNRLIGLVVALLVVGLILLAVRQHRAMIAGLPPRIMCVSPVDAHIRAGATAIQVLGTGSMAPYIPIAPKGADPLKTVVALAKPSLRPFSSIRKGDLVIYRPTWSNSPVIHQAAERKGSEWVMSGLNNPSSEPFEPIGQKEFVCIVDSVYVW